MSKKIKFNVKFSSRGIKRISGASYTSLNRTLRTLRKNARLTKQTELVNQISRDLKYLERNKYNPKFYNSKYHKQKRLSILNRIISDYGANKFKRKSNGAIELEIPKFRKNKTSEIIKSNFRFGSGAGNLSWVDETNYQKFDDIIQSMGGDFAVAYSRYQDVLDYKIEYYGIDIEYYLVNYQ